MTRMAIEKIPAGTRGGRFPRAFRFLMPVMMWMHRRGGDHSQDMDVLYLTTTGAKSGQRRTRPVARIGDDGTWIVVASAGGAQAHPAWYHNIVAHPDEVEIEIGGQRQKVDVKQLEGEERARVWHKVTSELPRFEGYVEKTDRVLPVLRLTPRA
jgi:deazaflavin-dependent oxidoreductase (nitroreductase family)